MLKMLALVLLLLACNGCQCYSSNSKANQTSLEIQEQILNFLQNLTLFGNALRGEGDVDLLYSPDLEPRGGDKKVPGSNLVGKPKIKQPHVKQPKVPGTGSGAGGGSGAEVPTEKLLCRKNERQVTSMEPGNQARICCIGGKSKSQRQQRICHVVHCQKIFSSCCVPSAAKDQRFIHCSGVYGGGSCLKSERKTMTMVGNQARICCTGKSNRQDRICQMHYCHRIIQGCCLPHANSEKIFCQGQGQGQQGAGGPGSCRKNERQWNEVEGKSARMCCVDQKKGQGRFCSVLHCSRIIAGCCITANQGNRICPGWYSPSSGGSPGGGNPGGPPPPPPPPPPSGPQPDSSGPSPMGTSSSGPSSGQPMPPSSGQPMPPSSGQPMPPSSGQPMPPSSGQPMGPQSGSGPPPPPGMGQPSDGQPSGPSPDTQPSLIPQDSEDSSPSGQPMPPPGQPRSPPPGQSMPPSSGQPMPPSNGPTAQPLEDTPNSPGASDPGVQQQQQQQQQQHQQQSIPGLAQVGGIGLGSPGVQDASGVNSQQGTGCPSPGGGPSPGQVSAPALVTLGGVGVGGGGSQDGSSVNNNAGCKPSATSKQIGAGGQPGTGNSANTVSSCPENQELLEGFQRVTQSFTSLAQNVLLAMNAKDMQDMQNWREAQATDRVREGPGSAKSEGQAQNQTLAGLFRGITSLPTQVMGALQTLTKLIIPSDNK